MTVAKEISKYKLDLMGVPEVRRDTGGTKPAGKYTFFYGKGNDNHELGTGYFGHKRIMSAIKRIEYSRTTKKGNSTEGKVKVVRLTTRS
jgi:hypothetical protein